MYGTNIIRGSLTILIRRIHGGVFNTLVVPNHDPSEWFYRQFPDKEMIYEYALENSLTVKEEQSGNQSE